jgi:hypothetical protein
MPGVPERHSMDCKVSVGNETTQLRREIRLDFSVANARVQCPLWVISGHSAIYAPTARLYWHHDLLGAMDAAKPEIPPQATSNDCRRANDSRAGGNAEKTCAGRLRTRAFKPNLTRTEADIRIAMLTAKLKLLGGPPHTL